MNDKRVLIMAGGTGGHVFPGLAVAYELQAQGFQVRWLGTKDRMEAELVPAHGIAIDFIQIQGIRGRGLKALLLAPWRIFTAWKKARCIIKAWSPNVVLGMGGYVSGPGGLAAWSCGIPVVLHEQNGIAGLTNQWLAKIASKVLQAFVGAFPNAEVVGNPVRQELLSIAEPQVRFAGRSGPIRVLVMGGSQGARIFNQLLPEVAEIMGDSIEIHHQSGQGTSESVQLAYQARGVKSAQVTDFIDNVATAYAWADVVVCRSGALTVSEIAAVGLAAIYVPFQHKDRQQYWNALPLEKVGAAKILEQRDFNPEAVAAILQGWDRSKLLTMANQAKTLAVLDATQRVAEAVARAAH